MAAYGQAYKHTSADMAISSSTWAQSSRSFPAEKNHAVTFTGTESCCQASSNRRFWRSWLNGSIQFPVICVQWICMGSIATAIHLHCGQDSPIHFYGVDLRLVRSMVVLSAPCRNT